MKMKKAAAMCLATAMAATMLGGSAVTVMA